ncbi:LTA synthase family protein [Agathobacter rectalis]|uniref:LTA synthase family protein n=1 Tax=Agathobacter rectalis TaxID=39491 RepID=UPI002E8E0C38|nr:LTA synthase family protein [Agathobacter rectalis]
MYIFLESMEMTYADESVGGAMSENYIPELTQISLENENFGTYGKLNGAYTTSGVTFTMGGLVAQTSGVPINENLISNDTLNSNWESDNNYVPGVWAIGDVLNGEGYNQEFLIGSDKKFAGRSSYFKGHGNYDIFDYYTAIDRRYIDDDYMVWWGYEDKKLFEYAKTEITDLANEEEPFNFTMLTVDTHFTDGYLCNLCGDEYDDQYSNVMACSSKQVAEFVEWIQEQEFYENTTIVISGDHLTMDSDYLDVELLKDSKLYRKKILYGG